MHISPAWSWSRHLASAPRFTIHYIRMVGYNSALGRLPNQGGERAVSRTLDREHPVRVNIKVTRFGDSYGKISSGAVYMFPGSWYDVRIRRGIAVDDRAYETYRMPKVTLREILQCCSNVHTHKLMRVLPDGQGGERWAPVEHGELNRRLNSIRGRDSLKLAVVPR